MFRLGVDPLEDFTVAFAAGELFLQRRGVNAGKVQEFLVERAGVFVFAVLAGEKARPLSNMRGKIA